MASLYYQRAGLPDTSHDGGCGLWIGTGYCHPGKHIPAYRRIPLTVAGSGALYEMELGVHITNRDVRGKNNRQMLIILLLMAFLASSLR